MIVGTIFNSGNHGNYVGNGGIAIDSMGTF